MFVFFSENIDFVPVTEALIFTERSACIDIPIIDDDVHEAAEYFLAVMNELTANEVGGVNIVILYTTAEVFIHDDGESLMFNCNLHIRYGSTCTCMYSLLLMTTFVFAQ